MACGDLSSKSDGPAPCSLMLSISNTYAAVLRLGKAGRRPPAACRAPSPGPHRSNPLTSSHRNMVLPPLSSFAFARTLISFTLARTSPHSASAPQSFRFLVLACAPGYKWTRSCS